MSPRALPDREVHLCEMLRARLWQSGCPVPFEKIKAARINAVVNVGHEEQPWLAAWRDLIFCGFHPQEQVRQHVYLHAPLFDASHCLDVRACDTAIGVALALLRDSDRRILVHCEAGAFRSIHVTAGIVAAERSLSGEQAFRYVDRLSGAKNPRSSLGMGGWHEHVQSFGGRR